MLPPGQLEIDGFPRFGVSKDRPPPRVPSDPVVTVGGPLATPTAFRVMALADLSRRTLTADFHCVSGWSATGLQWEGVPFRIFYEEVVAPTLRSGSPVTHLVFTGLDGFRSIVLLEDALGDDVLLADRLGGRPLDGDHGAPLRLLSPQQYGYVSTKHLCLIEAYPTEPDVPHHDVRRIQRALQVVKPHRRARVWDEERHRYLPSWLARRIYHRAVPLVRSLRRR